MKSIVTLAEFDAALSRGEKHPPGTRGVCPACGKDAALDSAGYLYWHGCPGRKTWEARVDLRRRYGLDRTLEAYVVVDTKRGAVFTRGHGRLWARETAKRWNLDEGSRLVGRPARFGYRPDRPRARLVVPLVSLE